jgi:hypothetical protein
VGVQHREIDEEDPKEGPMSLMLERGRILRGCDRGKEPSAPLISAHATTAGSGADWRRLGRCHAPAVKRSRIAQEASPASGDSRSRPRDPAWAEWAARPGHAGRSPRLECDRQPGDHLGDHLRGVATSVLGFASEYGRSPPWLLGRSLDHRHNASADGLGESIPGVDDGGQIGVGW